MLHDLVCRNRSYRRFRAPRDAERPIDLAALRELVNLGRLSASGRNIQPLAYAICCDPATNAEIFPHTAWAGYLTDWPGPAEGERPAAYIVVLGDKTLAQSFGVDEGLAVQNILLGAVERGLGGCIIGSVERKEVRRILDIPDRYDILHLIALGYPGETVVIEELTAPDGAIEYWRDAQSVHHVPKRRLADVIVGERG
jgi:nitroreductase